MPVGSAQEGVFGVFSSGEKVYCSTGLLRPGETGMEPHPNHPAGCRAGQGLSW